jgi:hypothetical protein
MRTLTPTDVRRARLSVAHAAYLSAAIERYRMKAMRALKLAQAAARHGNYSLAAGLIDEASAYRAMANGLEEQSQLDQLTARLETAL